MGNPRNNVEKEIFTIGDLKRQLEVFPDDCQLIFGDDRLTFFRTKSRGEKLVQIEFNETIERIVK